MRLRQLRKNAKLTLKDIAKLIGVSYQTVSNWENGSTEPDIQSIIKLADYFSVTTDYLLEHDNDEIYFKDLLNKLDNLNKEQLMLITKSMVVNLLENFNSFNDKKIKNKSNK